MINNLEEYHSHYNKSVKDPEKYWKDYSSKFLWKKEPSDVLNWNFTDPDIEWFKDGELNITENIFERNKEKGGIVDKMKQTFMDKYLAGRDNEMSATPVPEPQHWSLIVTEKR